ncbi:MAG: DUF2784 domain-containing protein [Planctomycetes bacterium]|nr:DUF2784 domain-containing protein [Planctomycetota bacterium]
MNGFLADLIVGVHVAYVAYVVVGLLLILIGWALGWKWVRNIWFRLTHLAAIGYVVYEEIMEIRCPLSIWEEHFRALAGQPTTGETFLGRMLHSLIFYDAPPIVFTIGYLSFGTLVLLTFLFCRPRWPTRAHVSGNPAKCG